MLSKTKANYKPRAKKYLCKNCGYFIKGKPNKCAIVVGKINPHGTCKRWNKRLYG